ncbi:MAG: hypothetical protein JST26_02230 [Bacteroidetes bacterium]|nr:hypothetical protein [Bacteroidota bacterium]
MKNKKLILFLIILFPSLFWLTLELSTINSKKLPFYGPKIAHGADTTYYTVDNSLLDQTLSLDTIQFPLYVIAFTENASKINLANISGLIEYLKYKKEAIQHVPVILACGHATDTTGKPNGQPASIKKQAGLSNPNVYELGFDQAHYQALVNTNYFKEKPYYIGNTFLVLIDKKRHIRGYYDGQFVSEVKRLIDEYKHIRLKEEQKNLLNTNKIESK